LLDHLVPDKRDPPDRKSASHYIIKIARLGGYLARANCSTPIFIAVLGLLIIVLE
jgi:hypothetical protein